MNIKARTMARLRRVNLGAWADFPDANRVKVKRLADGRRVFEFDTRDMEPGSVMELLNRWQESLRAHGP